MEAEISVYEHYCEQVRHHQDERRAIANTLTVVIGALIAVMAIDQRLDEQDSWLVYALMVVGVLGSVCMVKCHGLIRFYKAMSETMALRIGYRTPGPFDVKVLEETVMLAQSEFWQAVGKIRLWKLWLAFFIFVIIAAISLYFSLPASGWIPLNNAPGS
ncbi:MAG TPA: hypothetical protein VNV36_10295 [Pseudomonas sp.]|uniref:hypothetical protein n=1 Tax=Pseudomonas sp. TaxID=306 RepID=UPI002BCF773D|nr:hypothetical protein [Pseudomonas sp.]HWH87153.1 hypothetical protein [Pseudomonas sp.]